jgi:hypothetical protein
VFHGRLHDRFGAAGRPAFSARCARIGPVWAPVLQSSGQVSLEKESCGGYAITPALPLAFVQAAFVQALAGKVELA